MSIFESHGNTPQYFQVNIHFFRQQVPRIPGCQVQVFLVILGNIAESLGNTGYISESLGNILEVT